MDNYTINQWDLLTPNHLFNILSHYDLFHNSLSYTDFCFFHIISLILYFHNFTFINLSSGFCFYNFISTILSSCFYLHVFTFMILFSCFYFHAFIFIILSSCFYLHIFIIIKNNILLSAPQVHL